MMFANARDATEAAFNTCVFCPCCGAVISVQNGMRDDIEGVVFNSEDSDSKPEGTSSERSSCAMPQAETDAEAVISARLLRSELRSEIAFIFQSGILNVLATSIILFRKFMEGKLAEQSATHRLIVEISQAVRHEEKMRLRVRKRDGHPWFRSIHFPLVRARRRPA